VEDAVADADAVVLALWLDAIKELVPRYARLFEDKVVVDPSNPIAFDANGQITRTLPERESAGSVVAALLPAGAHYVKAIWHAGRGRARRKRDREPRRAVLFYATDDDIAATTIERLIRAAGFDPFKAGGVADAGRIEMPGGDLHQFGLNGEARRSRPSARHRRSKGTRMTAAAIANPTACWRPYRSATVS